MSDYQRANQEQKEDRFENQPLLLDGTVHLEYSEDEQAPRIKGLIELLSDYVGK